MVDAGPLYAYVDADDRHHRDSLDLLLTHPGPLIIPTLVVTELVYLIASKLGADAEVRFVGDVAAGERTVEPVAPPTGCASHSSSPAIGTSLWEPWTRRWWSPPNGWASPR